MSRIYNSQQMVRLPKLTGTEASSIIRSLLTRAASKRREPGTTLPPDILRSLSRLTAAHLELEQARLPFTTPNSEAAMEADAAVDNAFRAFYHWLNAWTLLPEGSHLMLPQEKALFELLFGSGLKFINEAYLVEWQEAQYRLEALRQNHYDFVVEQLGGRVLLEQLVVAHQRYGEVLGITASSQSVPDQRFKALLEAALSATREYVARVGVYPDPELPGSEELARALLEPLEAF